MVFKMKNYYLGSKLKSTIIFFLCLISLTSFASDITNIYLIKNPNYLGDYNQLLGISKKTKGYFNKHNISVNIEEYNITELESLRYKMKTNNDKSTIIILSAGVYGIEAIKSLKSDHSILHHILAIHVSHQILNDKFTHSQLLQANDRKSGADIIVLPDHVLDSKSKALLGNSKYTQLVKTVGVAHNLELSKIKKEYTEFKDILPKSDKYLGVILGGDAPDSNGKIHYYTELDAQKLAQYISDLAIKEKYTVLLTNSPRTGKHDPITGKERDGMHNNNLIDPVTLKFQEVLTVNKVAFKLFDFQKNKPNLYKAIVGAVLYNTNSRIFVPGESTSMISECIDILPAGSVTIYYNSAMGNVHERHVKAEFDNGRASTLDSNMQFKNPNHNIIVKINSANDVIAESIYNLYTSDVVVNK